jgi:gamma-glutamylaminecyclotransferase
MILFVFGTLKRGFPLHELGLSDAFYLGRYKTADRYPMVIAGPHFAPMMFNEPGTGHQVEGELYEVPLSSMSKLDALESMDAPGNDLVPLRVEPIEAGPSRVALAYVKARALATPTHSECLTNYQDRRFEVSHRQSATAKSNVHHAQGDAYLYKAADLMTRKHGADAAQQQALERSEYLRSDGQLEAAELWKKVARIIALVSQ